MKKRISVFLCLLISLSIGLPALYHMTNRLEAADNGEASGEKIIDFNYGFNLSLGACRYVMYAISESNHLYVLDTLASVEFQAVKDADGRPLTDIVQTAFSVRETSGNNDANMMALRSDGKIYVWGDNSCGQYGDGTISEASNTPKLIDPGIANIASMSVGEHTNFIVTANGDVYASGDNSKGQFGDGTTNSSTSFVKVPINNVKKITQRMDRVFALKNDGTVWAWGAPNIYDGKNVTPVATTPIQIHSAKNSDEYFTNAVDISAIGSRPNEMSLAVVTFDGTNASVYSVGYVSQWQGENDVSEQFTLTNVSDVGSVSYGYSDGETVGFVADGKFYTEAQQPYTGISSDVDVNKAYYGNSGYIVLSEGGAMYVNGVKKEIRLPFCVEAKKSDGTSYTGEEKYHDAVTLIASGDSQTSITCTVEDPVGSTPTACTDFNDRKVALTPGNQRIYRKYSFSDSKETFDFIVDLYQNTPTLNGYSATSTNKIKPADTITIQTPSDQASWNTYSATITDASGTTGDFTGGKLAEGSYTVHLKDSYGNAQDYLFAVKDHPKPTLDFTPTNTTLTYGDNPTKGNSTIGMFSLQYPVGEPTSTINTIQLGSSGDEAHFSLDTSGALKVKGNDLDAGTYRVSVSGTDGNNMAFSKTVSITVAKKDQNNYQITNNANYPFQVNQEINITTSGNDSGESETYTIIGGNSAAQISNSTKFKMLSVGTFTLQATVSGNTNYNAKTVTKQITISQLPTQNPSVSITGKDSMMYGDTYTPAYSGGQGSGAVSWTIENDNGTGAVLSNGKITVTAVGTFTLKVTKAGDANVQASSDTKVITVNKRKTTVKPKDVTKSVGQAFKDNGATYTPQPISSDNIGTLMITSKYPENQAAGRYTDGIQASGLSNPNYEFIYQEGTLIINSNNLPNNGSGYYTVSGTKGKNNWYVSDVRISTTGKNGYDEISKDGINFQKTAISYTDDYDDSITFYLKNSSTGIVAAGIKYQLKIDQTKPDVPTLTMEEINRSIFARAINVLSFGHWMNQAAQVTMKSSDATSGMDYYEYLETGKSGASIKTSTSGIVTYNNEIEISLKAKACDKAGNCSAYSGDESLMIDTKAPTITGVKDQGIYKHYYLPRYIKVTDSGSGLSYSEYKKDGNIQGSIQDNTNERIDDIGDYEVYALDNAGNEITVSFVIVPLPDIETEIDGSDEAKEIIDQIKDEYEEVKDKLDASEKQDYEQWIKDALDKWNSLRKKIVETDDQSAKIEGQGNTSFDPDVELIVEEISEEDIPKLPKKVLIVYNVYLRKGMTRIQPNGKIKVYLPYSDSMIGEAMGGAMESMANPIVYEIDTTGRIKQLTVQREGSFVTFITDKLVKYAISNDANEQCALEGKDINVDTDGDGRPDLNVDFDGDCIADINIDTDFDNVPDIDIDTKGDGKPDINIDTDDDGKADLNIAVIKRWVPQKDCEYQDFAYDTGEGFTPYLNIDDDGDGKPDRNIDPDWSTQHGNAVNEQVTPVGGVNTGDDHQWTIWWILMILTGGTLIISQVQKRKNRI